jgi:AbrB family looped-hinge helix DNA binding protein
MNSCSETVKVEAIVTIDLKGQIILPKDLREKASFKPNDKLAVAACEKNGEICCLLVMKAEKLETAVSEALRPILQSIVMQEEKTT